MIDIPPPMNPESQPTRTGVPVEPDELLALSHNLRRLAQQLVGDTPAADDLVQEAWLAALDDGAPRARDLSAWLRGVVRRLALRQRRRASRRSELERLMAAREAVVDESRLAEQMSVYHLLRTTIEGLRAPYDELLVQRYLEERPIAELARQRGCPQSTVRSQLSRGMHELREALDRKHQGDRAAWSALLMPWTAKRETAAGLGLGWGAALLGTSLLMLVALFAWQAWRPAAPGLDADLEPPAGAASARASELAPAAGGEVQRGALAGATAEPEVEARSTAATGPTRQLELTVLAADGGPVDEVYLRFFGRETQSRYDGHVVQLDVPVEELAAFRGSPVPGVRLEVRSAAEAWSPTTFIPLPPEGRSLELRTRGPGLALDGQIVDLEGQPVAGARVVCTYGTRQGSLRRGDGVSSVLLPRAATSDAEGRFVIDGLVQGAPLELFVRAPGFRLSSQLLQSEEESLALTLRLSRGETLSGVLHLPDGSPAEGARVWEPGVRFEAYGLVSDVALCDAAGRYELGGLSDGPHHVFAVAGEEDELFACSVPWIEPEGENEWNAVLAAPQGVHLRLVDEAGAPVPEALVVVYRQVGTPNWAATSTTDAQGVVHFPHVPDVTLAALARLEDREPISILRDARTSAQERVVTISREPQAAGRIRGRLRDAEGRPPAGAQIGGVSDWELFFVDVDAVSGSFEVEAVEPRSWALQAFVQGLGAFDLGQYSVGAGGVVDLGDVALPAPVRVQLEWRGLLPSADSPWLVKVLRPNREMDPKLVRSLTEPTRELLLLPGLYRLSSLACAEQWELEVPAQGPVFFVVDARER